MNDAGKRVVFDNDGSYIEDKATGHREKIDRVGNAFDFTTWVRVEHGAAVNEVNDNSGKAVAKDSGFTWLAEAF